MTSQTTTLVAWCCFLGSSCIRCHEKHITSAQLLRAMAFLEFLDFSFSRSSACSPCKPSSQCVTSSKFRTTPNRSRVQLFSCTLHRHYQSEPRGVSVATDQPTSFLYDLGYSNRNRGSLQVIRIYHKRYLFGPGGGVGIQFELKEMVSTEHFSARERELR